MRHRGGRVPDLCLLDRDAAPADGLVVTALRASDPPVLRGELRSSSRGVLVDDPAQDVHPSCQRPKRLGEPALEVRDEGFLQEQGRSRRPSRDAPSRLSVRLSRLHVFTQSDPDVAQ